MKNELLPNIIFYRDYYTLEFRRKIIYDTIKEIMDNYEEIKESLICEALIEGGNQNDNNTL